LNIVITGGAGYIGSKIIENLKTWNDIKVFDNLRYNQGPLVAPIFKKKKVEFFNEDVTRWSDNLKKAIDEADCIIPLAALVGAPLCDQYPDDAQKLNADWFDELLPLLNNQHVIYPNTNSGYGTTPDGEVCTEQTPLKPISLYGETKKRAEETLTYNYKKTTVFRLATLFGTSPRPRLDLLVNNLTLRAAKDGRLNIFDGHFRRNYVHVNDVAKYFIVFMQRVDRLFGTDYLDVFNLGNDSANCTKLELAKRVCKVTGAKVIESYDKTDPDKRDYVVSSEKLYNVFRLYPRSLNFGIKEMYNFSKYVTDDNNPMYRNY
jgi:nucleoside-diphosphate-sugar epimerase